jgi:hypothetical protein
VKLRLVEIAPGRWRLHKPAIAPARSHLPLPYVISDTMEPTEQVDGKFYTSKTAFRRVGRELGLIEVGNEKPKPKQRATADKSFKAARRDGLKKVIEQYKAGRRPMNT